ncbi:MAG: hypothetical protein GY696_33280 [Gammaproteobacteria bacterium]|nr:hypothetical protein [Gammaproteobacteria bacterium]
MNQWRSQGGPGGRDGWGSAQTPGRLRRKNVVGVSAPRPPPDRGLGRSLNGAWGGAPRYILAAKPPRGLRWNPNSVHT